MDDAVTNSFKMHYKYMTTMKRIVSIHVCVRHHIFDLKKYLKILFLNERMDVTLISEDFIMFQCFGMAHV